MQAEPEPPQEADTVEDQNNSLVAPLPSGPGALPAPDAAAPPQHQQGAWLGSLAVSLTRSARSMACPTAAFHCCPKA